MRVPTIACLCWILALPISLTAAEIPAAARAMMLAREAATAAEAKDPATYLAKMEQAAALRPDFPRILVNLAAAQLASEKPDDALATLGRLAALGFNSPVDKSEDFAALRDGKEFKDVVKRLAANNHPAGKGEVAFALREVTGLIEGIAWREATGDFYFGDVNGRAVWVRGTKEAKDGKPRRLTPEGDELLGVFGLAIDESRGALWAATSAVPAMRGFSFEMDGTAALAEIDLATGAIRRTIPVVRKPGDQMSHVLGDLALAPDGSVFVTDSGAPNLWRLPAGGGALEPFAESEELMSAQGIVVDAERGALFVAAHANGLLRVDLRNGAVTRLETPPDTSLIGLDGLARAPDGALVGIQNGLRPNRVVRIALDEAGESVAEVKVLEAAHLQMAAPSLGCIATGGEFFFVGNAGWTRFENTGAEPTAPRSVPVFKTKLPAPPKAPKR